MSIKVVLAKEDMDKASAMGHMRFERAAKLKPRWPYPGETAEQQRRNGIAIHTLGARGEIAFCRATGLRWPAREGAFKDGLPDVDPSWEVRTGPDPTRVKVDPDDQPSRLVVQVVSFKDHADTFEVIGYVKASWAQTNLRLEDPGGTKAKPKHPAFFVPSRRLAPINPDFHAICAWEREGAGFRCAFCGVAYAA